MKRLIFLICLLFSLLLVVQAVPAQDKEDKKKSIQLNSKYSYIQQNPALMKAVLEKNMVNIAVANQRTKDEVKDLNGLGPKNQRIPLHELVTWSGLSAFGLEPDNLLSYSLTVYPDANEDSGIFYYLPTRYFIDWDRDSGYRLTIDYNPRTADSDRNVLIQAQLTPGFRVRHYHLLKKLLELYLRSNGKSGITVKLQPLPASFRPAFDLSGMAVRDEDISLTGIDFETRELSVSIATTAEYSQVLINNLSSSIGIRGDIIAEPEAVSPQQPALSSFPIAANLRLCDNRAYARSPWVRSSGDHSVFTNPHPLPITLKYLVYLIPQGTGLSVRGFDLNSRHLAPGQRALLVNARINKEIDSDATLASWYEYSFDCDEQSIDAVVQALSGGVGSVPIAELGVDVLGGEALFEQYGIHKLIITVRSNYYDPQGGETDERVFELTSDTLTADCGPLYLRDGTASEIGENLYSYRIGVITLTGEIFADQDWRKPNPYVSMRTINIGAAQVEDLIGGGDQ